MGLARELHGSMTADKAYLAHGGVLPTIWQTFWATAIANGPDQANGWEHVPQINPPLRLDQSPQVEFETNPYRNSIFIEHLHGTSVTCADRWEIYIYISVRK